MGRHDNRLSKKVKQRRGQASKKARIKRRAEKVREARKASKTKK